MQSDPTTNDTVLACPECDSTGLRYRATGPPTYRCEHCGTAFNEAVEREPHGEARDPGEHAPIAQRLIEADPEEIP